jgi:hypothetical protein
MRKTIRYYITNAGEEPTVRSVRVAMSAADRADHVETAAANEREPDPVRYRMAPSGVQRLVKGAISKRTGRA